MLSQLNQRFNIDELHNKIKIKIKKEEEEDIVVNKDWCGKEKKGGKGNHHKYQLEIRNI